MVATKAATADDYPPDDSEEPTPDPRTEPTPQGAGGTIWDNPNQQVVRADGSGPVRVPATGATAGIPATLTPAGAAPPYTVADLQGGRPVTVTATPATAWTTGQYVQTGTAGTTGRAYWNATAWTAGAAP